MNKNTICRNSAARTPQSSLSSCCLVPSPTNWVSRVLRRSRFHDVHKTSASNASDIYHIYRQAVCFIAEYPERLHSHNRTCYVLVRSKIYGFVHIDLQTPLKFRFSRTHPSFSMEIQRVLTSPQLPSWSDCKVLSFYGPRAGLHCALMPWQMVFDYGPNVEKQMQTSEHPESCQTDTLGFKGISLEMPELRLHFLKR